jgi:mannitol operon transcriptional antiterminator
MLLTKREEQLMKAFQDYGKLSIDNISDVLKVSKRTVYRTISDLTESLNAINVSIIKDDNKYFLVGELSNLTDFTSQEAYSRNERLNFITYKLLTRTSEVSNEELQIEFGVSNVTIIQDIAEIESRLSDFSITLERRKGYYIPQSQKSRRWVLAILISNAISLSDFWNKEYGYFEEDLGNLLNLATQVFKQYQADLPDIDARMSQLFIILLALANQIKVADDKTKIVSKASLDFSKNIYSDYSQLTGQLYTIQEILYYAAVLDEFIIKRQEVPLFNENFDSEFFYSVSNLIDKVALYTKINFAKDKVLFNFLFNHIRLSLAVPTIFEDSSSTVIAHHALRHSDYLHRVVTLLIKEIFPTYLQSDSEYELITLHFASSLRRSPDIYPIQILLLTDERQLARDFLMTRIKTVAPFVDTIHVKTISEFQAIDKDYYDCIISTKPLKDDDVKLVPTYPDAKEIIQLQEFLQDVQSNREVKIREHKMTDITYDFQNYILASQFLLERFSYQHLHNAPSFERTVPMIVSSIDYVSDKDYLSKKLLNRFEISPMAIPETYLALLHTYSSKVSESCFMIFDLETPVAALSMNRQTEMVSRVLVMLTRLDEKEEIRDLMTAISQSIIENHLYTEIYKTGNRDIIYQLLNQIFTEKIKKLEN